MNRQIILTKRPKGMVSEECFKIIEHPIPTPKEGEVLIKSLYLSVDPYMRGRMNAGKSYIAPFKVDNVITGGVVGEVIETKSEEFQKGDIIIGDQLGWQDYSIAMAGDIKKIDYKGIPITTALGILGMPGLTGYFGLLDIGNPQKGETVVISGAAGAVGTTAGQIGKIKGCRVVGISGSDEKNKYLVNELGFTSAVNYKDKNFRKSLIKACPDGVDVYFDNVGGPVSDTVMALINYKGRITVCGQISMYNLEQMELGPRAQIYLLVKSALMKGFIVWDYKERFNEAILQLTEWVKEGRLKYKETVTEGLENAPKAFISLFTGEKMGKTDSKDIKFMATGYRLNP